MDIIKVNARARKKRTEPFLLFSQRLDHRFRHIPYKSVRCRWCNAKTYLTYGWEPLNTKNSHQRPAHFVAIFTFTHIELRQWTICHAFQAEKTFPPVNNVFYFAIFFFAFGFGKPFGTPKMKHGTTNGTNIHSLSVKTRIKYFRPSRTKVHRHFSDLLIWGLVLNETANRSLFDNHFKTNKRKLSQLSQVELWTQWFMFWTIYRRKKIDCINTWNISHEKRLTMMNQVNLAEDANQTETMFAEEQCSNVSTRYGTNTLNKLNCVYFCHVRAHRTHPISQELRAFWWIPNEVLFAVSSN